MTAPLPRLHVDLSEQATVELRAAIEHAGRIIRPVAELELHARPWDPRRVRVGFPATYLGTPAEPHLVDAVDVFRRDLAQGRRRRRTAR